MILLTFDQATRQVAINPVEISDVCPMREAGWTLITLRNRKEFAVKEEYAAVVGKIRQVPITQGGAA